MLLFILALAMLLLTMLSMDSGPRWAFAQAPSSLRMSDMPGKVAVGSMRILKAVTVALVAGAGSTGYPSQNYQQWTVISTADGDTVTPTTTHGMGVAWARAFVTGVLAAAQISLWVFTTYPSQTTWAMTKTTGAGSGNAAVQARVDIVRAG